MSWFRNTYINSLTRSKGVTVWFFQLQSEDILVNALNPEKTDLIGKNKSSHGVLFSQFIYWIRVRPWGYI